MGVAQNPVVWDDGGNNQPPCSVLLTMHLDSGCLLKYWTEVWG